MGTQEALDLVVIAIVAIWGIYQIRLTKRLEYEVHRLSVGLDQSIQLLYRAREAVIKIHSNHVFLLNFVEQKQEVTEVYFAKLADMSAYQAELRGLAFAIKDQELLDLVNGGDEFFTAPDGERHAWSDEMAIRGRSQKLHTRISDLLQAATQKQSSNMTQSH